MHIPNRNVLGTGKGNPAAAVVTIHGLGLFIVTVRGDIESFAVQKLPRT